MIYRSNCNVLELVNLPDCCFARTTGTGTVVLRNQIHLISDKQCEKLSTTVLHQISSIIML